MGTYTTNYNLYMPTVGEQSWGTLVNGNFTTIDTTMKSLSNNISSLDSRLDTVETYGSRITAIENEVNGTLSCTSVTTSGKITGNGGIAGGAISGTTGTFSGALTCNSINSSVYNFTANQSGGMTYYTYDKTTSNYVCPDSSTYSTLVSIKIPSSNVFKLTNTSFNVSYSVGQDVTGWQIVNGSTVVKSGSSATNGTFTANLNTTYSLKVRGKGQGYVVSGRLYVYIYI